MMTKTAITTYFKNIRFFLRFGDWEWTCHWGPTLATLLLLPLFLSLGCWQLHRAMVKQQLLNQFALRGAQPPQPLTSSQPLYSPVRVTGHYDPTHLILLDNRIVNHQAGYDVLAPFVPADGRPAILVNMGWIPRQPAPYLQANISADEATIVGLVKIPEHNIVLAHPKIASSWPLIVEDIRIPELIQLLHQPLYPFILLLSGEGGFKHHWEVVTTITPARHRGYAVQWFALALTLVILYFKLNLRRVAHE